MSKLLWQTKWESLMGWIRYRLVEPEPGRFVLERSATTDAMGDPVWTQPHSIANDTAADLLRLALSSKT